MSKHIEIESNMRFSFDASKWSSLMQYDVQTDYKNLKNTVQQTKAVDFIGILEGEILSFIEVKNFRGHRIENKPRLDKGHDPLELEIAQKVRDTIAGIIAFARESTHSQEKWAKYSRFLLNPKKRIDVVLWLEEDENPVPTTLRIKRDNAKGGFFARRLKQKMKWLTPHVSVFNIADNPYDNSLKVELLPEKAI